MQELHRLQMWRKRTHFQELQKEANQTAFTTMTEENLGEGICLMAHSKRIQATTWIADSGVSGHMVNSKDRLFNIQEKEQTITIGNRKTITIEYGKELLITTMGKKQMSNQRCQLRP